MAHRFTSGTRSSTTITSSEGWRGSARSSSTRRTRFREERSACSRPTASRLRSGRIASSGASLILVIGSETSSNARRLVEVAEREGAEALLIDGESGLDPELLVGHQTVGLTAGASTPEELVALVLRSLASLGYDELEEVEVAREDVHFRLPREVATRP